MRLQDLAATLTLDLQVRVIGNPRRFPHSVNDIGTTGKINEVFENGNYIRIFKAC